MAISLEHAILEREVLVFEYDGGRRIVEPHGMGATRAGRVVLRGFQIGGYSRSGRLPEWRLFYVDRITALQHTGVIFRPRPDFRQDDPLMEVMIAHV